MKILLLGANGQVGWALQRSLAPLGLLNACGRDEVNLEDLNGLRKVIREYRPDMIINAAAYTAVDKAESVPEKARLVNTEAVSCLADEAKQVDALLVHFSTDYVFDGTKSSPYTESDEPNPLNVYGTTKWEGEEAIRQSACKHLIFRTSWVYAVRGDNFIKTMLRLASRRDELSVVADQIGAPTHADMIADVTAFSLHYYLCADKSLQPNLLGTYHLVAAGEASWNEYARFVLEIAEKSGTAFKVRSYEVERISSDVYPTPAERPKNSRLNSKKLEQTFNLQLPDWRDHVCRTMQELLEQGGTL